MRRLDTNSFDHVALWVSDREPLTKLLCEAMGLHVIDRTDEFTLVGADAREGKLTLFAAEGPREHGALDRVVLRVGDLDAALGRLPAGLDVTSADGRAEFEGPEGLGLGLVEADGLEYDLDHVVLRVPDPAATAERFGSLGFERRNGAMAVADRRLVLEPGAHAEPDRPLLNHLALLVDSMESARAAADQQGAEIVKTVDAENTLAVFVRGPDGIVIEYVEHKSGFSLV
jgi:catechol 2,3-dioxygenase-like lactoylglutathione lyase family enzyme